MAMLSAISLPALLHAQAALNLNVLTCQFQQDTFGYCELSEKLISVCTLIMWCQLSDCCSGVVIIVDIDAALPQLKCALSGVSARTSLAYVCLCSKKRATEQEAERWKVFPCWWSWWAEVKSSTYEYNDKTGECHLYLSKSMQCLHLHDNLHEFIIFLITTFITRDSSTFPHFSDYLCSLFFVLFWFVFHYFFAVILYGSLSWLHVHVEYLLAVSSYMCSLFVQNAVFVICCDCRKPRRRDITRRWKNCAVRTATLSRRWNGLRCRQRNHLSTSQCRWVLSCCWCWIWRWW